MSSRSRCSNADWRPTARREILQLRAQMLAQVREFFAQRSVLEVETPALSITGVTDPNIRNMTAGDDHARYLQSSPEAFMKRLLASGSGDIYQICKVFREAELGHHHREEFTLIEWYRSGIDERDLMTEVDTLLSELLAPYHRLGSTECISYRNAFVHHAELDPFEADSVSLTRCLSAAGHAVPDGCSRAELLDLIMGSQITPALGDGRVTFICDYPADQAAMARIHGDDPRTAARFEVFCFGLELGNGFHELNDAGEQRQRLEDERAMRRAGGLPDMPVDEKLLAALEAGLPDCAGVAVGFDRLLMLAAGVDDISKVMSFG